MAYILGAVGVGRCYAQRAAGVPSNLAATAAALHTDQSFVQTSSVVLLDGTLRQHLAVSSRPGGGNTTHGGSSAVGGPSPSPQRRGGGGGGGRPLAAGAAGGGGKRATLRHYSAPTLLIWSPELFAALEDRYDTKPRRYSAGRSGALLLVAPGTEDGAGDGVAEQEADDDNDGAAGVSLGYHGSDKDRAGGGRRRGWFGGGGGGGGAAGRAQAADGASPPPAAAASRPAVPLLRLSSMVPLVRTMAPSVGPDQNEV